VRSSEVVCDAPDIAQQNVDAGTIYVKVEIINAAQEVVAHEGASGSDVVKYTLDCPAAREKYDEDLGLCDVGFSCGGEFDADDHVKSCKELKSKCAELPDGEYWIRPHADKDAIKVTCDMDNNGFTLINSKFLSDYAKLTIRSNSAVEHKWVGSGDIFYSYPTSCDYEVWNTWDLGIDYTSVMGKIDFYPSKSDINSWSPNGHPDNNDYGVCTDTGYETLGKTGEGSGNKSWQRWGKPGMAIGCGSQLGWSGEYGSMQTSTGWDTTVPAGTELRLSSFSECGDVPNERWAWKPEIWIK
jgi:hypothetical protein